MERGSLCALSPRERAGVREEYRAPRADLDAIYRSLHTVMKSRLVSLRASTLTAGIRAHRMRFSLEL